MTLTGTITDDQARALAQLVALLSGNKRWDVAGTRSAIHAARHRGTAHELAHAAIRCTQGDARTPAVIALDGPHWHAEPTTTSARATKCPIPGHESYYAWNCGACRSEGLERTEAHEVLRAQGVPTERVRAILAGASAPAARSLAAGDARRAAVLGMKEDL